MYRTIEEAQIALHTAEMDVAGDFGEDMVEAAHGDIVRSIASSCSDDVAEELLRREGMQP